MGDTSNSESDLKGKTKLFQRARKAFIRSKLIFMFYVLYPVCAGDVTESQEDGELVEAGLEVLEVPVGGRVGAVILQPLAHAIPVQVGLSDLQAV